MSYGNRNPFIDELQARGEDDTATRYQEETYAALLRLPMGALDAIREAVYLVEVTTCGAACPMADARASLGRLNDALNRLAAECGREATDL